MMNYAELLWESVKKPLHEGGWRMPSLTSKTPLTPDTVSDAMVVLKSFLAEFAKYLKKNPNTTVSKRGKGERQIDTSMPLKLKGATGSTYYHKIDQETGNKAVYGDIDVSIAVPQFIDIEDQKKQREEELWFLTAYKNQLRDFILTERPKEASSEWIDAKQDEIGKEAYLILDIGNGRFVQIDLVYTFEHVEEWDKYRGRPERGLKGFVTGQWFASVGDPLKISMTLGKLPFYRKGASKKDIAKNLFIELVKEYTGDDNPDVSDLKGYEGIAVDNFTFKYLVQATVQLGKSLEKNGAMAMPDFLKGVKEGFINRMKLKMKSPKFKGALTGDGSKEEQDNYKKVVNAANKGIEIVNSIINENKSRQITINQINKLSGPVMVLTSGGTGSGKSYTVDKYLKGFTVVDSDLFKPKDNPNDKSAVKGAMESAKNLYNQTLSQGDNVVFQSVSKNAPGVINKLTAAKNKGYTTVFLRVEADPKKAFSQMVRRMASGGHGITKSPEEAEEFVAKSVSKSKEIFDEYKNSTLVDYYVVHKN